jgi:membrane dipeptidase
MFIADMHCDSLLTVSDKTGLVSDYNLSKRDSTLQFFAAFVRCGESTLQERKQRTRELFNIYLSECSRLGICEVKSGRDVFRAEGARRSAIFAIEGGGGLLPTDEELRILRQGGLSVFGLCWDKNELASSAFDDIDDGLTDMGRLMVDRLNELSVIIDVSHLSDKSFYEVMELSPMPVLATHSNFREVCKNRRNLTLPMAKMIAKRGGVIGINIYPPFLSENSRVTKDDILRQVDFGLTNLSEDAIGFGFDIDGTGGIYPEGISPISSIHDQVIDLLLSHYQSSVVEKIAGLNVLEFLKNNLP